MKKKLLSVLLAGCMVLSLAACGNDGGSATPDATQPDTQAPAADTTDNAAADNTEGGTLRKLKLLQTRRTVNLWTVSSQKRERLR